MKKNHLIDFKSKIRLFLICLVLCPMLTSCYAFLQADRLVYAGTLAKKTASVIQIDTLSVEVQNETETNLINKLE